MVDCERSEHAGDVIFLCNARIAQSVNSKTGLISKNGHVALRNSRFTRNRQGTD